MGARGVAIRGEAPSTNQRAAFGSPRLRVVSHYLSTASSVPTCSPTTAHSSHISLRSGTHARAILLSSLRGSVQWCIDDDRRGYDGGPGAGDGGGHQPRRRGCPRQAGQGGQGQEARRTAEAALQPRPPAVLRDDLGGDHDAQGEGGIEPVRDRQVHRGQAQGAPAAQLPQAAARAAQEARLRRQAHQGQEFLQGAADARPSCGQAQSEAGSREAQGQTEGRQAKAQGGRQAEGQGQGHREAEGGSQARRQAEGSCEAQGGRQACCQAQGGSQAGRKAQGKGGSQAEGRDRDQDEGDLRVGTSTGEGSEDFCQGHAREEGACGGQEARRGGEEGPSQEGRAGEEGGRSGEEGSGPEGQEVELGLEAVSRVSCSFCFSRFSLFLGACRGY